jgi:hypothetical protein
MDEQRAARLQTLTQHPSWAELVAAVQEHQDNYAASLTKRLLATGEVPDDLDYRRGMLAGMRWLVQQPALAAKTFEQMVARRDEGDA